MYVRKEALASSQIEGTQCAPEDVLNPEIGECANADVSDVVNYVRAINFAVRRPDDLPLCSRLVRETRSVLMSSIRGGDKTPGEVRRSGDYEQRVRSFLRGHAETADDATETVDRLNALHQKNEAGPADVPTRPRNNIMRLFAYIGRSPIIGTGKTAAAPGLSRNGTAD